MTTAVNTFDSANQTAQDWINELTELLDCPDDPHRAYLVFRSVLHVLRDRLPVDEAVSLAAQLPMLVRGFYYEGWQPHGKPTRERKKATFLSRVRASFPENFDRDPEQVTRTMFQFLASHLTPDEIEKIASSLPDEIRSLWSKSAANQDLDSIPHPTGEESPSAIKALPTAPRRPATGWPEDGSGQGRVDVTGTMPEGIRVDPDITRGHPGYEESGGSGITPTERGGTSRASPPERPGDAH